LSKKLRPWSIRFRYNFISFLISFGRAEMIASKRPRS